MFRNDKCTITRPNTSKTKGEVIYGTPTTVANNVPCHLSVKALSPINQTDSTATVLLDYVLFTDANTSWQIKKNDIITVVQGVSGNTIELRAGESQKYPFTTQTHCEKNKVS